jgi:hypothetical protein
MQLVLGLLYCHAGKPQSTTLTCCRPHNAVDSRVAQARMSCLLPPAAPHTLRMSPQNCAGMASLLPCCPATRPYQSLLKTLHLLVAYPSALAQQVRLLLLLLLLRSKDKEQMASPAPRPHTEPYCMAHTAPRHPSHQGVACCCAASKPAVGLQANLLLRCKQAPHPMPRIRLHLKRTCLHCLCVQQAG